MSAHIDVSRKSRPDVPVFYWGERWGSRVLKEISGMQVGVTQLPNVGLHTPDSPNMLIHIDGTGVFKGKLLTQEKIAKGQLSNFQRDFEVEEWGRYSHGPVAAYMSMPTQKAYGIYPDPLGGAIIFYFGDKRNGAASTSLRDLREFLDHQEVKLTKSSTFFTELVGVDSGGASASSSYEEIEAVPPFHYLQVTNGVMEIGKYKKAFEFFFEESSTDDLFEETVVDLISNATAYASHDGTLISHLTAGVDSRLVAASLLKANVADQFGYYCAEDAIASEQIIARKVAAYIGLEMTRNPGTSILWNTRQAILRPMLTIENSEGLRATGPHAGYAINENLVLSGVYGEPLRGTYSAKLAGENLSGMEIMRNTWPASLVSEATGIASPTMRGKISDSLDEKLAVLRGWGLEGDPLSDMIYVAVRNRYWAGHSLLENSRYTAHGSTLYSLAGHKLALEMQTEDRVGGRLIFDLFQVLAPDLLSVEFDEPKFSQKVFKDRFEPKVVGSKAIGEASYNSSQGVTAASIIGDLIPVRKITSETVATAKSIRLPAWQVAYEKDSRDFVKKRFEQGDPLLLEAFDKEKLRTLLSKKNTTRQRIRTVHRIYRYLSWYSE